MRLAILIVLAGFVTVAPARARADGPVELVVVVNGDNDETPSSSDLESYFLRRDEHWGSGVTVIPLNYPPDSALRRAFDHAVLSMSPDDVVRYWLDQRIRSGKNAPRELADPAIILKLVARFNGAIGYLPASSATRGVRVVARIRGGKLLPP